MEQQRDGEGGGNGLRAKPDDIVGGDRLAAQQNRLLPARDGADKRGRGQPEHQGFDGRRGRKRGD